jgi:ABC-type sugar transport system permease subunit
MAILTIMIFHPFSTKPIVIGNEARFLFLVFGIITLINSNWGLFFQQAKWFDELQYVLGETRFGKR